MKKSEDEVSRIKGASVKDNHVSLECTCLSVSAVLSHQLGAALGSKARMQGYVSSTAARASASHPP